jgi:arabinose-5-phosphate isomerase
LLEAIRRLGARLIAMTGVPGSPLGVAADVTIDCHVDEEACPLNLVPTASTTAMLALGDALAMTLLVEKGFKEEDFANLHPGGKLGKRFMRVEQLMHGGAEAPIVQHDAIMGDVIYEMSSKALGMTCVVENDRLMGIITDGDLRRHMGQTANILDLRAEQVMTRDPVTLPKSTLAVEALNVMEQKKITAIVVVDERHAVEGVIHLHGLWRTEMF